MSQIGDHRFAKWDGPPPPTPAPVVETFEVPGKPYLGARLHANRSTSATVTLTTYVPFGGSAVLLAQYRARIGTSQPVYHAGILYAIRPHAVLHFVEAVEIVAVRRLIRARGVWHDGSLFDLVPAEEVVSRWILRPVPSQ